MAERRRQPIPTADSAAQKSPDSRVLVHPVTMFDGMVGTGKLAMAALAQGDMSLYYRHWIEAMNLGIGIRTALPEAQALVEKRLDLMRTTFPTRWHLAMDSGIPPVRAELKPSNGLVTSVATITSVPIGTEDKTLVEEMVDPVGVKVAEKIFAEVDNYLSAQMKKQEDLENGKLE
ncbi:MAG TPA: hypothetical protein VLF93_00565 [Candidatus Saccharimonadales bacterium]|nr:hypothetical protein [Candidatus Saccharimonadales bacterium]